MVKFTCASYLDITFCFKDILASRKKGHAAVPEETDEDCNIVRPRLLLNSAFLQISGFLAFVDFHKIDFSGIVLYGNVGETVGEIKWNLESKTAAFINAAETAFATFSAEQ